MPASRAISNVDIRIWSSVEIGSKALFTVVT